MKKVARICMAALLALSVAAFAACGETETPPRDNTGAAPGPQEIVSPLSVLDTVDMQAAFAATEEGGAFALQTIAEFTASSDFGCTSEVSGKEKLYSALAATVSLADTFGIRPTDRNPLGADLFGGGTAGLAFSYTGPEPDSEPIEKSFEAGIRHDGDLIWYAGEGGTAGQIGLSDVTSYLGKAAENAVFDHLLGAAALIPEEIGKGATLRLGVEKLVELGFVVEIDDTDGISVRIAAGTGFFTDLLNDALEAFLPAEWLQYIPRADFRYTSTEFDVTLAFDANGLFKEYTVKSDVRLGASLEMRGLFRCEGSVGTAGGFSVRAYTGEVPGFGAETGQDGAADGTGELPDGAGA